MGTLLVMEGRYLRSVSLHAGEEAQKQDLTRVKTLKRHLMKTLKRKNTVIGTTIKNENMLPKMWRNLQVIKMVILTAMLKPQIQKKEFCGNNPEAFFHRGRKGFMFSLKILFIPSQKGARPMKL